MPDVKNVTIILLLFFSLGAKAQTNSAYTNLIQKTNEVYGADDLLSAGERYSPSHPGAKGHPYFFSNDYSQVTVYIYNHTFKDILAKYNLETGRLVILSPLDSNKFTLVSVIKSRIDSFKIHNRFFINFSKIHFSDTLEGYCELAYRGKKSLLVKHTKKYLDASSQGSYTKVKASFYIFDQGGLCPIKNKKQFLRLYPMNVHLIRKHMRKNKIKFLKATVPQLNNLMQYCETISK